MPATAQDIIDFFALSGNNPTVTNAHLQRVGDWATAIYGIESPTPDDLVDILFQFLRQNVISYERSLTEVVFE